MHDGAWMMECTGRNGRRGDGGFDGISKTDGDVGVPPEQLIHGSYLETVENLGKEEQRGVQNMRRKRAPLGVPGLGSGGFSGSGRVSEKR